MSDDIMIVPGETFLNMLRDAIAGTWTVVNDKREGTLKLTVVKDTVQLDQQEMQPHCLYRIDELLREKAAYKVIIHG